VLEAVHRLNYVKNVHARRLATGRSDLFALVISEIANPYFPEIIRGFQAAAWERNFDVLLCNTEYRSARTEAVMRKLLESDVRGVAIMTSSFDTQMTAQLSEAGIGLVFSNLGPPQRLISNIYIDYQRGNPPGHRAYPRARASTRCRHCRTQAQPHRRYNSRGARSRPEPARS